MSRNRIDGTSGDDILTGTSGNDDMYGLRGDDSMVGGAGNDYQSGGHGHDTLMGGDGNDVLTGGPDTDFLDGGAGRNVLEGGAGDDTIVSTSGIDIIEGDRHDDITAAKGVDLFVFQDNGHLLGGNSGLIGPEELDGIAGNSHDEVNLDYTAVLSVRGLDADNIRHHGHDAEFWIKGHADDGSKVNLDITTAEGVTVNIIDNGEIVYTFDTIVT